MKNPLAEVAALVVFGKYVDGVLTDTPLAKTLRYLVFKREVTRAEFSKYYNAQLNIDESQPHWWEPIEKDYETMKKLQTLGLFTVVRRLVPTTGAKARRASKRANYVVWNTTTAADIVAAIPAEHHHEVVALWERKMLEDDIEGDYWLKVMGLR